MELAATLHQRTLNHPAKAALITPTETLTYGQLYATAWDLAVRIGRGAHTRARSGQPSRVGLLASNPVDLIAGYYAGALSGTSVVILDPVWPDLRLRTVIADLGLEQIICGARTAPLVGELAPEVERHSVVRHGGTDVFVAPEHIDSDHELMVVFTSGTTTSPKAICRSRASWQASLRVGTRILHATASQVTLVPGPLAHGLSLYAAVESITTGGTALLTGKWDSSAVSTLLARYECSRVVAVPSILGRLLAEHRQQLNSLQFVICGGEALSPALRDAYEALAPVQDVVEYYGTSEHSLIAYRTSADAALPRSAGFTGRSFPGVDIQIHQANPQTGIGEIFVHSPMLASDYHHSSTESFRRRGRRVSVQDHGSYARGILQMAGRAGGMINLGGNNLHPSEVGEALARALGVTESRLLLASDPSGEARLVAFLLAADLGDRRNPQLLLDLLHHQLPKYKIPHELALLDHWPMTNSGKISTSRLLEAHAGQQATRVVLR